MNKTFIAIIVLANGLLSITTNAEITDVFSSPSTAGFVAEIIAPPTEVLNDTVTNMNQQGFDEAQGIVTTVDHYIDGGGFIPAGTPVDSHMIFLNAPPGPNIYHDNVIWTFSGPIIGVMSDSNGSLEVASTPELGASGTNYPTAGFSARGIEGGDNYTPSGNQLMLSMGVDPDAGDWIRVVTLASIMEPCIDIEKSVSPEVAQVGDIVTYTICVTNCGETLWMVEISDMTLDFIFLPFELAPGEVWCEIFDYEIQPEDSDPLVNEVIVFGIDNFGNQAELFDVAVVDLVDVDTVAIDIKPGSCPNPLNVKSQGVLPVAVLGTEFLDVSDVDVASVSLAGVAPIRFDYEDVATPFEGELCDCHEDGSDGYLDLTLKFDTQEIVAALGDVQDGEELPLSLSVTLVDGTVIEGSDCIRVIKKGKD
ncbi:MAG: hypothetical protein ACYSTT_19090 [Planctomycetota bacterium]|jgi:hypothetical protein